ncbi:MAG TPA: hypothetical protein PLI09_04150 [Candidatus Hydrogenedentes bacterium]|nr:hypothetical protein [Candidatus Hydrogenedentota bacterium]
MVEKTLKNKKEDISQDQINELLEKAMKRPGVQDVMDVYDTWRYFEEASRPLFQAMSQQTIFLSSNNTSSGFVAF